MVVKRQLQVTPRWSGEKIYCCRQHLGGQESEYAAAGDTWVVRRENTLLQATPGLSGERIQLQETHWWLRDNK